MTEGHDLIDRRIDLGHSLRPKMSDAFFKMSRSRSTRGSSSYTCRTRDSDADRVGMFADDLDAGDRGESAKLSRIPRPNSWVPRHDTRRVNAFS